MIRTAREPEVETPRRQDAKPSQGRVSGLAGPGGCLWQPPLTGGGSRRERSSLVRTLLPSGPRAERAAGPHTVDASASCPAFIAARDRRVPGARPRWSPPRPSWRLGVLAFFLDPRPSGFAQRIQSSAICMALGTRTGGETALTGSCGRGAKTRQRESRRPSGRTPRTPSARGTGARARAPGPRPG